MRASEEKRGGRKKQVDGRSSSGKKKNWGKKGGGGGGGGGVGWGVVWVGRVRGLGWLRGWGEVGGCPVLIASLCPEKSGPEH